MHGQDTLEHPGPLEQHIVDADGWVKVDRPEKEAPAIAEATDPFLWVVFSKRIGIEKILIRFPVEPSYQYMNDSEMKIVAQSKESEHSLHVLSPEHDFLQARKKSLGEAKWIHETMDAVGVELIYWKNGYWFMERLILSPEHSYLLQTKNTKLDPEAHHMFVTSFDLRSMERG